MRIEQPDGKVHAMRSVRPNLILAAVTILLTGCGVRAPSVEITDVALGEVTEEGFVLDFHLTLNNPNDEPLELDRTRYELAVNGEQIYSGLRSAEAVVRANGDTMLRVPAVARFDLIGAERVPESFEYELRGKLWYLSPGEFAEILFDAGVQRPKITYRAQGTLRVGEEQAGE